MINQGYLLLIEDEPQVQAYYKKVLERRGYIIRQAFTLAEARTMIGSDMPRAIVLDIGLPDGSGLDFLHELRKTSNVPVLMLTAMGTPKDVVKGLETGGDIYLAKPCELSTFISYVDALLRRSAIIPESLTIGRLKIELVTNKAFLDGEDMYLAAKEVSLLMVFAQNPDKVLSAEYLYEKVWGQEMSGDDQAVKSTLKRLRKKLDNSGYAITAKYGEGFVFEKE